MPDSQRILLPKSLVSHFAINSDSKPLRELSRRHSQPAQVIPIDNHSTIDDASTSMSSITLNDEGYDDIHFVTTSIPNVLQFLAPTLPLSPFVISLHLDYISIKGHVHSHGRQEVRHNLDHRGQRCGLWWERAGYVYVGRGVSPAAESKMMLVGISKHDAANEEVKGPSCVEGEIELFNRFVYPKVGPGNGLVNVLVVDKDMGYEFGERVTVARIYEQAWEAAKPVMKMVRLA